MGADFSKSIKEFFSRGKGKSLKAAISASLKKKPLLQRANEIFFVSDLYSEPIQFNFKGLKSFPSLAGSILSTVVRTSILIFAATIMLSLVGYTSEEIYSTNSMLDSNAPLNF